jgi:MFS family permease
MNFAFADGVERYHTSRDDLGHLNPGSVQHHGNQMLSLAKTFGNGELPRPKTADGVFFDLPVIGLIVYPEWMSVPLAVVALVLVGMLVWRARAGVFVGAAITIAFVVLAACAAWAAGRIIKGPGLWSGLNALGIVLLVIAVGALCRRIGWRWTKDRGLHVGGLVVLAIVGVVVSVLAPGVSYLIVWPTIFAAAAALWSHGRGVLDWLSVAVVLLILAGFSYGASVVMLGLTGAGAIALGVLTAIIMIILVPQFSNIEEESHWSGAAWAAGGALVMFGIAAARVHTDADHPERSGLVYALHVDSTDAWLGSSTGLNDEWTREVIGTPATPPAWTFRTNAFGARLVGKSVPRVQLDAPNATLARDTTINGFRRVVLRVTAPQGSTDLLMRAPGARVATASIDGRIVDTTRYRYKSSDWTMQYYAVPDSGAIVALSIPIGSKLDFELVSSKPGLPVIPGTTIPSRPANVVPSQDGDVSVVLRRFIF